MKKEYLLFVFSLVVFLILTNIISAAITVVSPASNTNWSRSTLVVFNVSYVNGTDYNDALNATFYYNLSGAWTYIDFTTDCNNDATFASCNKSINISSLTQGRYSINATLGNNTAYGASVIATNVVFDWTPPNVSTFYNTLNNGNYSGTITLNVSVSDSLLEVKSVYFNITNSTGNQVNFTKASNPSGVYYNATLVTTGLPDGKYNITIYANDTLNNLNTTERIQITIDNTAPTATFSCSPSTVTVGDVVTCSCTGSDATSGVLSTTYTATPSTISDGTFTQTCSVIDYAGNTGSASTTYTVNLFPSGIIKPKTTIEKINSWTKITPETTAVMKDFKEEFGIKQIQIEVNEKAENVKLTVIKYKSKPEEISVASGKVDKYLEVKEQNLKENLKKATITIQVEKSWISSNSLERDDIALFKFGDISKQWNELTTTYKTEDATYYYYDVEVTSFSYFAIGEKAQAPEKEGIIAETIKQDYWWIWIVVAVVVLGIAIFFWFKRK